MIVKNQSMVKRQNCVIWIRILHTVYIKADNVCRDIFIHWMVFRYMYLEKYELDTAKKFSGPGLAWQAVLKNIKVKLHCLTDIDMLLMVENVRGRIWYYISWYAKANDKCIKDVNKKKKIIIYSIFGCIHQWAMLQKLPVNNFQWIKDTSGFNEDTIKYYNEESNEEYFLEVYGQYLQKLCELHNNLPLLPEGITVKKV